MQAMDWQQGSDLPSVSAEYVSCGNVIDTGAGFLMGHGTVFAQDEGKDPVLVASQSGFIERKLVCLLLLRLQQYHQTDVTHRCMCSYFSFHIYMYMQYKQV
jgi:hypothetical protein